MRVEPESLSVSSTFLPRIGDRSLVRTIVGSVVVASLRLREPERRSIVPLQLRKAEIQPHANRQGVRLPRPVPPHTVLDLVLRVDQRLSVEIESAPEHAEAYAEIGIARRDRIRVQIVQAARDPDSTAEIVVPENF